MARKGPVTLDTTTIALGLAQIRVLDSSDNIGLLGPQGTSSNSIGALANTKYMGNTEWYELESGFPLIRDYTTPIRENAALECSFKEITPFNMALAHGIDPVGSYTDTHSGEVALGGRVAPEYVRMEAEYTYPDGTNKMTIIFPRAQVQSDSVEIDLAEDDAAAVPIQFIANNASSDVTGGDAVWDDQPLGRIQWTDS